jgi:sugar/nucleoside kinase (ribokinase family)
VATALVALARLGVVTFAAACAAFKTRALGGRTALPTLSEVEALLARQGPTEGA